MYYIKWTVGLSSAKENNRISRSVDLMWNVKGSGGYQRISIRILGLLLLDKH